MVIIFSLGCAIQAHLISRRSKLNNGSSREFQMVITFHTDVRFRLIIYRDARNLKTKALEKFIWSYLFTRLSDSFASHIETLEIEQRKLSRNSNGHNCSHVGPIQAYNISRRSKLNIGSWGEFQMVIIFRTDVWFGRIICWDAQNWTTKFSRNSNGHNLFTRIFNSGASHIMTLKIEQRKLSRNSNGCNFSHECPIRAHNMTRRSILNNGSSREIQMVITFHT